MTQQALVQQARRLAGKRNEPGRCLDLAWWTCVALAIDGHQVVFQAGSASWPLRQDWDRPDEITHVSFEWNLPSFEKFMARMMDDTLPDKIPLPEIHCWAGILDTQEVVDLTPCFLPSIVWNGLGFPYDGDEIDYIWEGGQHLAQRGIIYRADKEATVLAYQLARQMIGEQHESRSLLLA